MSKFDVGEGAEITDIAVAIAAVRWEYEELGEGFLALLRDEVFDPEGLQRLLSVLDTIQIGSAPTIDRVIVGVLWSIPSFMDWQRRRFEGEALRAFDRGRIDVYMAIKGILGGPFGDAVDPVPRYGP